MTTKQIARRGKQIAERPEDFLERALAGQLSPHTQRAYARDIAQFLNWWLTGQAPLPSGWQVEPQTIELLRQVTRAHVLEYRADLARAGYKPLTVNRKLAVVRSLLAEAVAQGVMPNSPAAGVKGLKVNDAYQGTPALSRSQARALVAAPDRATLPGLRDRALLHLALRCGLRCQELADLRVGDQAEEQGHHVLRFRGKGQKVRRVKVPTDVARDLRAWIEGSARRDRPEAPLFVALRKVGRGDGAAWISCESALTTQAVNALVKRHLERALAGDLKGVGPHALRATFITLALKGGAALHKVQAAAGHADPRTTMRYARLADDLDDNAADYVRLSGED